MNRALPKLDLIHQSPELLLFSDFVMVLAYHISMRCPW
jgi:hypothetical protein